MLLSLPVRAPPSQIKRIAPCPVLPFLIPQGTIKKRRFRLLIRFLT